MKPLRKLWSVILVVVGWWLSPLTWWNDAFVNLPIAWLVASLFAHGNQTALVIGINVIYWATNVLGFLMMHWGGRDLLSRRAGGKTDDAPQAGKSALRSAILWSLAYSALVTALVLLGVIKPLDF